MSKIGDLKQRVDDASERFGQMAEQDQKFNAHLTSLLSAIEKSFARNQEEKAQLRKELAQHREENEQLRSLLQHLLDSAEASGMSSVAEGMSLLESRIGDLLTDAAPGASAPAPDANAAESSEAAESTETAQAEPAEETPPPAPEQLVEPAEPEVLPESVPEPPLPEPTVRHEAPAEAPRMESAPAAPMADGQDPEPAEDAASDLESAAKPETEAPDAPEAPESAADGEAESVVPPSDDDLSAVNKIIQRVSLLTGEYRGPEADSSEDETPSSGLDGGSEEKAAGGS